MPVDERTFAADVKGWVDAILERRKDLPFSRASVEEHGVGNHKRLDFKLYDRGLSGVALTGEIKMPDSPQGKRGPLDGELIKDAFEKAARLGSPYYFTWNVREFVLFQTHKTNIAFMDRRIEGPRSACDAVVSDDVRRPDIQQQIKAFWEKQLARLAAIRSGAPLEELPLDRRFVARIEASLEHPISETLDAILAKYGSDDEFRATLDSWMVIQGWEPSREPVQERLNLDRAARLSCYTLLNRLVFMRFYAGAS
jgi:hypothetical protein